MQFVWVHQPPVTPQKPRELLSSRLTQRGNALTPRSLRRSRREVCSQATLGGLQGRAGGGWVPAPGRWRPPGCSPEGWESSEQQGTVQSSELRIQQPVGPLTLPWKNPPDFIFSAKMPLLSPQREGGEVGLAGSPLPRRRWEAQRDQCPPLPPASPGSLGFVPINSRHVEGLPWAQVCPCTTRERWANATVATLPPPFPDFP